MSKLDVKNILFAVLFLFLLVYMTLGLAVNNWTFGFGYNIEQETTYYPGDGTWKVRTYVWHKMSIVSYDSQYYIKDKDSELVVQRCRAENFIASQRGR